ncbi:MAG: SpaA isopeptide-forming pilin-related protein [Atopobiaceae bacterium]
MKKISIKRKALTCLSTAALLAAMAPGVALAADSTFQSNVTLTGLQKGDTVAAYEIVDSHVDATTNNFTRESKLAGYSTTMTDEQLGSLVKTVSLDDVQKAAYNTAEVKATADENGNATFTNLDDGSWLFIVTNADGHHRVYQNTVVNTEAQVKNGAYVVADAQQVAVKYTESPNPSKTISLNGQQVESGSVQKGETYDFQVTFGVPTYPASAINRQLVVTDTPQGFKDDTSSSSIVVKNGTNTVDAKNYTVITNGDGFKVSFTDDYIKNNPNANLTLTYKATATSFNAETGELSNTVDVNEGHDTVTTKTYGFYFEKVGDNSALKGATFTLKDSAGKVLGTSTSDDNGYVFFNGLQDGATYTVSETSVPTGYQAAPDFKVTINAASATGDNPATTDVPETNYQTSGQDNNQVVDAKQGALPTTGGAGTIGLTVAGVVLVAGGATLVLRARKNNA